MSHQVVAVHAVHWTVAPGTIKTATAKAKKPETKVFRPGETFVIDDDAEYGRLKAKGAVRDWGSDAKPQVNNDKAVKQADAGVKEEDDGAAPKATKGTPGKGGKRVSTRSKTGGEKAGADDVI